jgi:hypothetical protein
LTISCAKHFAECVKRKDDDLSVAVFNERFPNKLLPKDKNALLGVTWITPKQRRTLHQEVISKSKKTRNGDAVHEDKIRLTYVFFEILKIST